jgi:prepilin-type N-terminal cleavage/methylation domain-containing protein
MVAAMIKEIGFTLVELLVSLAIASFLFVIAIPSYEAFQQKGRLAEAKSSLFRVQAELERYVMAYQVYPKGLSDLLSYDDDRQESKHGYFELYLDPDSEKCGGGACYILVADPTIEARKDERMELYSDGRRKGPW